VYVACVVWPVCSVCGGRCVAGVVAGVWPVWHVLWPVWCGVVWCGVVWCIYLMCI
jgi:hypothetical protein